jgi:hypothetical protein
MATSIPRLRAYEAEVHLVLCDFDGLIQAFVETDPGGAASRENVIRNLLAGKYGKPLRVITLNAAAGWSRDISGEVAFAVASRTAREGRSLSDGARDFLSAQLGHLAPEDKLRLGRAS